MFFVRHCHICNGVGSVKTMFCVTCSGTGHIIERDTNVLTNRD